METLTILWLIPVGCTKLFNDFLFLGFNHSRGALSQLTEERRRLCAVPWGFRTHSVEKDNAGYRFYKHKSQGSRKYRVIEQAVHSKADVLSLGKQTINIFL